MKVSREQATENRARIVEVAGRLFRERGFEGIAVADLMQAAGLTHGGFYGHFASKDDLAARACERALAQSAERWRVSLAKEPAGGREDRLRAFLRRYLGHRHRDNPGEGCVYAALAVDVARQRNPALRRVFTEGLRSFAEMLAALLPSASKAARRRRALAMLSGLVGAMVLARAVDDPALSDALLEATAAEFGRA